MLYIDILPFPPLLIENLHSKLFCVCVFLRMSECIWASERERLHTLNVHKRSKPLLARLRPRPAPIFKCLFLLNLETMERKWPFFLLALKKNPIFIS